MVLVLIFTQKCYSNFNYNQICKLIICPITDDDGNDKTEEAYSTI